MVEKAFGPVFEAEAAMTKEMEAAIRNELASTGRSKVVSLVLFGSYARGTKLRPTSDLDLLIVLPSKKEFGPLESKLEQLRATLFRRFHVPLSPYVQTPAELRDKHHRKVPLIAEILKDGRTLFGKEVRELMA